MSATWCAPDGTPLRADTPHTVTDGERRWPVVDDITWLRRGERHDGLRARAVAALDDGDVDGAAAWLFADGDDWWDEAPPPPDTLRRVRGAATLREAVDLLGMGRVGTYFLHRWSDPSWLATLGLTAAHPPAGRPVVDAACGAGHLLRHLAAHGHRDLTGLDVVFAKLWLARRFLVPADTALACADLTAPWPVPGADAPRYVCCHDALYFVEDKAAVVAAARRCAGTLGAVVAGHCHNADHPSGAGGVPLRAGGWMALVPGAVGYAEEQLTEAAVAARLPWPATIGELAGTEALALVDDMAFEPPDAALLGPAPGAALHPNPLYVGGELTWPDERWAAEYGERAAAYLPAAWDCSDHGRAVRSRVLVDLPERW